MSMGKRRNLVAIVGDTRVEPDDRRSILARDTGRFLVDAGCRVMSGGLGGVMTAALAGARLSEAYAEGDTLAILPGSDPAEACSEADIVLATGLGLARNVVIANADAVVAVGGGAGTLSEIALAWQLRRPIVSLDVPGWGQRVAGARLDHRERQPNLPEDRVHGADSAEEAVRLVLELIPKHPRRLGRV